jgi:hypothetical protein
VFVLTWSVWASFSWLYPAESLASASPVRGVTSGCCFVMPPTVALRVAPHLRSPCFRSSLARGKIYWHDDEHGGQGMRAAELTQAHRYRIEGVEGSPDRL